MAGPSNATMPHCHDHVRQDCYYPSTASWLLAVLSISIANSCIIAGHAAFEPPSHSCHVRWDDPAKPCLVGLTHADVQNWITEQQDFWSQQDLVDDNLQVQTSRCMRLQSTNSVLKPQILVKRLQHPCMLLLATQPACAHAMAAKRV